MYGCRGRCQVALASRAHSPKPWSPRAATRRRRRHRVRSADCCVVPESSARRLWRPRVRPVPRRQSSRRARASGTRARRPRSGLAVALRAESLRPSRAAERCASSSWRRSRSLRLPGYASARRCDSCATASSGCGRDGPVASLPRRTRAARPDGCTRVPWGSIRIPDDRRGTRPWPPPRSGTADRCGVRARARHSGTRASRCPTCAAVVGAAASSPRSNLQATDPGSRSSAPLATAARLVAGC